MHPYSTVSTYYIEDYVSTIISTSLVSTITVHFICNYTHVTYTKSTGNVMKVLNSY